MNFAEISAPIGHNATLNPKIWEGSERLKSEVRGALLTIAEDFYRYVDVPFTVVDVVITGSNVNYNYTNKSDIDLHLIADFDSVDCDREAAELFDTKRLLYEREHDIEVYGIPVGLYVENQDHPGVSAGSYSIQDDRWIKEPSKEQPEYDSAKVAHMTKVWTTIIQHAMQTGDLQVCRNTLQLLRKYRKLGLQQPQGEFSTANLVYKVLRNDDIIHGIDVLVNRLHDNQLSLHETNRSL
jgi:hypothetical protein